MKLKKKQKTNNNKKILILIFHLKQTFWEFIKPHLTYEHLIEPGIVEIINALENVEEDDDDNAILHVEVQQRQ